jgi:hypothetical protein
VRRSDGVVMSRRPGPTGSSSRVPLPSRAGYLTSTPFQKATRSVISLAASFGSG